MNINSFFLNYRAREILQRHNRMYGHIDDQDIRNLMLIFTPRTLAGIVLDRNGMHKNDYRLRLIEDMILGISEFSKPVHDTMIEIHNDLHDDFLKREYRLLEINGPVRNFPI